ncbi:MAG TPA: NUDIX hydrolase [Gemmatimonadales bacterium]|nr:NUDIX hydrolase [Gemmatimonadales bacterium]
MTLLSTNRIYTGKVLNLDLDTVRFPDGSEGTLEMIRHPGASAVLPFLDDPADPDPRVILIRQFRHAAEGYVWEIPAGRLEPGEPPETCAHRELMEETGYTAAEMRPLITIYTTPGFTDERIHLFLATGLEAGTARTEPDEFLEIHTLRLSEVIAMADRGEIQDGKTLCAVGAIRARG